MEINKRIVDNGNTVGYIVMDGDFLLPVCEAALYTEMYMAALVESGYKYYGYDPRKIKDKNGNLITGLEAVELSTLDYVEWQSSIDFANDYKLSDFEASKFYTFEEESVVEFRREDTYEINTREELLRYLDRLKSALYSLDYSVDNRPLNSFVNPDVLFTIDELNEHPELRTYFDIIVKRHHFRNYESYSSLVKWLNDKGVLNTDTPTVVEFLTAYYAWGPEGITGKCINQEVKLNVDGAFNFMRDPLSGSNAEDYVYGNRVSKIAAMDARDRIHYLKLHEDIGHITDVKEFQRAPIMVQSNDMLMLLRRANFEGKKYLAVDEVLVSDVSDRMYFTLVTESGYTYMYKISHDKIKIGLAHTNTNQSLFSTMNNFAFASMIPGILIPFANVESLKEYYLWNLAIAKSIVLTKERSYKAPVNSTAEYMLKDGVNPIAVIDMMAHSIGKNTGFTSNNRYTLSDNTDDLFNALELYLKDLPDYLLQAYCLNSEDIEHGVEDFLELADIDDLNDRREAMMAGKIAQGQAGFDPTFKDWENAFNKEEAKMNLMLEATGRREKMYDAIDYYTKLKFVYDCLHGDVTVNNFGDGKISDAGTQYLVAAEFILSLVYAEYGHDADYETLKGVIETIDNSELIDINKVFKVRDAALKGYMVDFAEYRKRRASTDTYIWCYCTKVFREISNAPVEKQRPYLMEILMLDNSKSALAMRSIVTELVKAAIEKQDISTKAYNWAGPMSEWNDKRCAEYSTEYLAATLFFRILAMESKNRANNAKGGEQNTFRPPMIDGEYSVKIQLDDSKDLDVRIPENVYQFIGDFDRVNNRRYITVYDYCKYEYNPNTNAGTFQFLMTNATIDPWHVRPKKGYSIGSYSLLPNYYDQTSLDNANGEGFYLTAHNDKKIVVEPIKGFVRDWFIPESPLNDHFLWEEQVKHAQTLDDLEFFLMSSEFEPIYAYVRRWAIERKAAAAQGKRLISIPLKQDIVYGPLAPTFCTEIPSTCAVHTDDVSFDDKQAQNNPVNSKYSWNPDSETKLIEGVTATLSLFSTATVLRLNGELTECLEISNKPVVAPITVTGNYINVKGDEMMRVMATRLDSVSKQNLVNAGILNPIGDGLYFIHALNGDFVLEDK